MSGLFNSLFSSRKKKEEDDHQSTGGAQSLNTSGSSQTSLQDNPLPTLNEIQILSAHTEPVKVLLKIDEKRLASAGDDYIIYIWSIETGRNIMELIGHTNRVTCLLSLNGNILVSGSMDKSIKMWDLSKPVYNESSKSYYLEPIRTLLQHVETIKYLEKIPGGFCSASIGDSLHLWFENGDYNRSIAKSSPCTNAILCVNNNYIVTAESTSPFLIAYRLNESLPPMTLGGHNGSVNCLLNISDKYFVSGSRPSDPDKSSKANESPRLKSLISAPKPANDKTLIIWSSTDFTQVAHYSCNRSISSLYQITENYILATIYKGFGIFDTHGNLLLEYSPDNPDHKTEINGALTLYDNTRIITWGDDPKLTMWAWNMRDVETKKKSAPLKPIPIGEIRGHTDYIKCVTVLGDHSIATGGSDNTIIMWKDGKDQSSIRNHMAGVSLYNHQTNYSDFYDEDTNKLQEFKYEDREPII
ncbi:hypothetical protein SAMD00019534_008190, partial [Acytostelium subglobosum LB1]|uniref:hypothetical protein n=1 Tax=Acytostelium subglobosum LB1 TaxID=1410327 RepID=UPI0006448446